MLEHIGIDSGARPVAKWISVVIGLFCVNTTGWVAGGDTGFVIITVIITNKKCEQPHKQIAQRSCADAHWLCEHIRTCVTHLNGLISYRVYFLGNEEPQRKSPN